MTLNEAIRHCEEIVEQAGDCQCAADHRQLAEWLRDYQKIKTKRKPGTWIRHHEVKNVYGGTCIECSECRTRYMVTNVEEELFCRNCGSFNAGEGEQE